MESMVFPTLLQTLQPNFDLQSIFSYPLMIFLLIMIGFVAGISIGVSGTGGAPILLPALVLIGMTPHVVVGTDLAFAFFTKIFATAIHTKIRNINWQVVTYLIIAALPAMLFASWLWIYIKDNLGVKTLDNIILFLLGVLLAGVAFYLIKKHVINRTADANYEDFPVKHRSIFSTRAKNAFFGGGILVGFVTQITSTGAGAILLPLLIRVIRYPKYAAGTSVIVGVAISAVGAILHYSLGNVPIYLVFVLLIGSLPGVFIGIKFTSMISFRRLMIILISIILGSSMFVLLKGISSGLIVK